MIKLLALSVAVIAAISIPVSADEAPLQCEGSLKQRVKCLDQAVFTLSSEIAKLREQIRDRPTTSEVAEMIKAATDHLGQSSLRYGSVVTLQLGADSTKCIDKRSQDATTIQAWRCNNDNNHRLQHWTLIPPN